MAKYIIKSSGEVERFSVKKLKRSLRKAGAPSHIITRIVEEILKRPELDTTKKIYDFAYNQLKGIDRPLAARYSLKNALYELGPTGYLFENYIALIFKELGFKTQVGLIEMGACVDHEVDIIMEKGKDRYMAECKFHNRRGIKTDVKVALYIKARFEDLSDKWETQPTPLACDGVWLVTNTQFTSKAIQYGNCAGLMLLGWDYPKDKGLAMLIDSLELHPITSLTCITKKQKRMILKHHVLLCRDLIKRADLLKMLGIRQVKKVTDECKGLCPSTTF